MKKLLMMLAILVTLSNVSLGVAYACSCTDNKKKTCCGSTCSANADGSCSCSGACTGSFAETEEMLVD
jgi:hypothetical protein